MSNTKSGVLGGIIGIFLGVAGKLIYENREKVGDEVIKLKKKVRTALKRK